MCGVAQEAWDQNQVAGAAEGMGVGLKRGVEEAGSKEAGTCIGSWVP